MSKVVLRALDLIGDHLRTHKSGGGADAPLDLAKQVVTQRMDNPAPAAPPVAEAAPKNTTQGSVFAPKPRVVAPSGLYSHAAEVAGQLQQNKGSAEQMIGMMTNAGVKPAELEHAGMITPEGDVHPDWAGRTVTRDELHKHLTDSMPKVEEKVLGVKSEPISYEDWAKNTYPDVYKKMIHARQNNDAETFEFLKQRLDTEWNAGMGDRQSDPTKYQKYTLPGGENYRELLLQSPESSEYVVRNKRDEILSRHPNRESALEAMKQHKENDPFVNIDKASDIEGYNSDHWHEPNVLAHVRMSDRTGPNGEKLLHVEELQSDWGQKGREQGFAKKYTPEEIEFIDPKNITDERRRNQFWNFRTEHGGFSVPKNDRWPTADAAKKHILNTKLKSGVPEAPYVTSTQGWTDLALKRVLKEAAEGGYHGIVFTPGKEQAKRYPGMEEKAAQGLQKFYDNIVTKRVQELAKQHDKDAKLGHMEIPDSAPMRGGTGDDVMNWLPETRHMNDAQKEKYWASLDNDERHQLFNRYFKETGDNKNVTGFHLPVTDKMRESVLKGQKAFADGGEVEPFNRGGTAKAHPASIIPGVHIVGHNPIFHGDE